MVNWNSLIDETALASLLPGEYARFARPVRDALNLFLSRLPAERQTAVLAAQMSLPPSATVSQRLGRLAQCCPVLHKLGQILACEPRLAAELRAELQLLESLPPSVSWDAIETSLTQELGPLEQLGLTLAPPAIAEASVAVVVPFVQNNGDNGDSRSGHGVFKLLKPGIEERMEEELALLEQVGAHLDEECEELDIPRLDYQEAFGQVRDKLLQEVRLDEEQRHLAAAAATYAGEPRVQIPELMDYCTPRVTAMQRVFGRKVTDHDLDDARQKRRLAKLVVNSLIAQPIFAKNNLAVFHSDPHAGNLFLTDDGRLAILDWSLVGTLDKRQRAAVVQILLGGLTLHAEGIVAVLRELGDHRLDEAALRTTVDAWLRRIRHGQFPGLKWLVGMLDEAVATAGLRIVADLLLFRKSLYTLDGVVGELGADGFQMDEVLVKEFLCHFTREWPLRWLSLPHSREFATRLSNWDLTRTVLGLPWTASRFWLHNSLDLIRAAGRATADSR